MTDAVICPTFAKASAVYINSRHGSARNATSVGPRIRPSTVDGACSSIRFATVITDVCLP